jgi:hypothetical protein
VLLRAAVAAPAKRRFVRGNDSRAEVEPHKGGDFRRLSVAARSSMPRRGMALPRSAEMNAAVLAVVGCDRCRQDGIRSVKKVERRSVSVPVAVSQI